MTIDALWTTEQLAEFLGVPVATVYAWRSRGEGPPAFRVGRYLRFRADDVVAWLDRQRHKTRPKMSGPRANVEASTRSVES